MLLARIVKTNKCFWLASSKPIKHCCSLPKVTCRSPEQCQTVLDSITHKGKACNRRKIALLKMNYRKINWFQKWVRKYLDAVFKGFQLGAEEPKRFCFLKVCTMSQNTKILQNSLVKKVMSSLPGHLGHHRCHHHCHKSLRYHHHRNLPVHCLGTLDSYPSKDTICTSMKNNALE